MFRTAAFTIAGIVSGLALAFWWQGEPGGSALVASGGDAGIARRIAVLESALAAERRERGGLEAQLDELRRRLDALPRTAPPLEAGAGAAPSAPRQAVAGDAEADAGDSGPDPRIERGRRLASLDPDERRAQRLLDAGFTPDRVTWINERVADLRMEEIEAQYAAARGLDPGEVRSSDDVLRAELGDADYERYLEATGRGTSVGVRDVLPTSPAAQAGLQPGDEVVGYAGERVFEMEDLNRLILSGQPGETVLVDVVRDGQPIQLYIPRGPLGITGGRPLRGRGR